MRRVTSFPPRPGSVKVAGDYRRRAACRPWTLKRRTMPDPAAFPRSGARRSRIIERIESACAWLALPLALLLFLQWPLREIVQAYSREANDVAQILFALYVSVAITAATRRRMHLAADALASRRAPRVRRQIARVAALAVLLPWSVYLL